MSLAHSTLSADAHTYPGSSIFHPGLGNIDIGRQAADIGDVTMQLNLEAFYYYWPAKSKLPPFPPPPPYTSPFILGGKYDLESISAELEWV